MVVQQSPMRELALFAGAGGGILGGHLLGWRTVCAVERDAYVASILVARQNDKILPVFPIWSDVTTFDGRPWRGCVDVISGGFPCQDISAAGKGAGINGKRSGLWGEFARIIGEVRPRYVFVENSPMLTSRGLGRVLGDLASMGYDARWCVLGADDVGAPHVRKRIWILAECANTKRQLAYTNLRGYVHQQSEIKPTEAKFNALGDVIASGNNMAYSNGKRLGRGNRAKCSHDMPNESSSWWRQDPAEIPQSNMGRLANGFPTRVDETRAFGNAQVPIVAATAFNILSRM